MFINKYTYNNKNLNMQIKIKITYFYFLSLFLGVTRLKLSLYSFLYDSPKWSSSMCTFKSLRILKSFSHPGYLHLKGFYKC